MKFKQTEIGKIPVHWRVVSIKEIGKVVGGGTPSTKKKEYFGGSIPWITPKDLSGYNRKRIQRGERNITELGLKNSSAKLLPKNTVLLSSRAPIGYVAIADNPLTTNQGFRSIICDESKIIPDYLYYYLKMSKYSLENLASGSTFKEISGKVVEEFKIPLPPLEEQRRITRILSLLDSKIELNETIIGNMEQLAQTLFKRWFIDFEFPNENGEPYKSSGGKMVQSELGEIPEGWQVGSLSTFIKDVISGDWGKDNPQKNYQIKVHVIRGTDIPEIRIGREGKVPIRYVLEKNFKKKFLLKGDVIIEISGGSPTQSTGRTLLIDDIILKKYDYKVICTNFCRAIRPKEPFFGVFIHLLLMKMYNDNLFFQLENGTTGIKNLDIINLLEKYPLILPSNKIIKLFADKFSVLLTKIQQKGLENKKLKEVRDTLLPKLLSGEIELPDESGVTEHVHVQ